jgi:hypothetical protein
MPRTPDRSYRIVAVTIAAIVVILLVWQPWNANGGLWGK